MKKSLHISAGGKNTRIKEYLVREFDDIPKHILPIPGKNTTILEKIVADAYNFFEKIIIEANSHNILFIKPLFINHGNVEVLVDKICSGPLGPIVRFLQNHRERTYGCAGDFFCDLNWDLFERFHKSHKFPVSILVSKSTPAPKGAVFRVKSKLIRSWERVELTTQNDLINIGAYIIDATDQILEIIDGIEYHKEDIFFDLLIKSKLITAYDPGTIGFNINTPITYKRLCDFLNK